MHDSKKMLQEGMVNAFGLTYAVPTYVLDHSESETRHFAWHQMSRESFHFLEMFRNLKMMMIYNEECIRMFPKRFTSKGDHMV